MHAAICLEYKPLIEGIEPGSQEAARLIAWYHGGEPSITAMPTWLEFV
jgi:hypothetical protein